MRQEDYDRLQTLEGRWFPVGGKWQDKPIKYAILGPVKCGTCSLQDYYRLKYPEFETIRLETIWSDTGFDQFEELLKDHPGVIPIIITRDPADALWSNYWYFKNRKKGLNFEDWLKCPLNFTRQGDLRTPAEGYNFPKWIKKWEKYNVQVVSLEEIKSQPDFPRSNISADRHKRRMKHYGCKDDKWPVMSPKERQIAEDAIKLESLINNFKR